jgi:hypothetical protein
MIDGGVLFWNNVEKGLGRRSFLSCSLIWEDLITSGEVLWGEI